MMMVERYISQPLIGRAEESLQLYRRLGDEPARRELVAFGLQVLAGIAMEYGWEDAKKDGRPRGVMTECVEAAIDDACGWGPSWRALTLPEGSLQEEKWRPRYELLKTCLLELIVGEASA